MKYLAKELLNGMDDLDNCRDLELRECANIEEATKFTQEMMSKNMDLKIKRQKKDYDKILLIELFFEKKDKNE